MQVVSESERAVAVEELRRYAHSDMEGGGLLPTLKRALGVSGTWRSVLLRIADLVESADGRVDREELVRIAEEMATSGERRRARPFARRVLAAIGEVRDGD